MKNTNRLVLVLFEEDDTGYVKGVLLGCDTKLQLLETTHLTPTLVYI